MHIPIISPKKRSQVSPGLRVETNSSSSSDLKPPRLEFSSSNSNISEDFSSEPPSPVNAASPARRQLSDKLRATPSSVVRNTRIFSNFDLESLHKSNSLHSFNSTIYDSNNVNSLNKVLNASNDLPPELSPIVTLFTCHSMRIYKTGQLAVQLGDATSTWYYVEAKLSGNELAIWGNDELNPKYYNLFDYSVSVEVNDVRDGGEEFLIKFSNDLNHSQYNLIIRFTEQDEFLRWVNAFNLSNFEKHSLNEAFTAVILSMMGPKLSDIHILLSNKKRFAKSEWCNIRFPQVNHKWLKVFMVITPGTSKKKGKMEMYTNDKTSKKNLICYISDLSSVYNVYPENVSMIEFNALMKLNGDVYVNKNFEHLFYENKTTRSRSNSKGHSKTPSAVSFDGTSSHRRTVSQSSSFFSNLTNNSPPTSPNPNGSPNPNLSPNFIRTNFIYLMPVSHPGVSEVETMIRNLIHIFDAFKLYGRPEHLISDKTKKESLLFALPSLPHFEYLSTDHGLDIIEDNMSAAIVENWTFNEWIQVYKKYLEKKIASEGYKGAGNISSLAQATELAPEDIDSIHSPILKLGPGSRSPTNSVRLVSPLSPDFQFDNLDNYEGIDYMKTPPSETGLEVKGLDDPISFNKPISF